MISTAMVIGLPSSIGYLLYYKSIQPLWCLKMGRVFLAVAALFACFEVRADSISLPRNPAPRPKSNADEIRLQHKENLRKKREIRRKRNPRANRSDDYWKKKTQEDLEKLGFEESKFEFGLSAGLGVLGFSEVSGSRSNYQLDPPTFFHTFWRLNKNAQKDQSIIWLGFRSAMITGWGSYENIPGRFGFVYYGPMIALGNFSPVPVKPTEPSESAGKSIKPKARTGHIWMLGIATMARFGDVGDGIEAPDKDLNSKNEFDPPGAWVEYRYSWIHYKAIDLSVFLGVQTGKQKIFYYFGTAVGGWL